MNYFKCENEDCGAMYFTDAFEGFECVHCKSNIVSMTYEESIEHLARKIAYAAEHPTISC